MCDRAGEWLVSNAELRGLLQELFPPVELDQRLTATDKRLNARAEATMGQAPSPFNGLGVTAGILGGCGLRFFPMNTSQTFPRRFASRCVSADTIFYAEDGLGMSTRVRRSLGRPAETREPFGPVRVTG